MSWLYALLIIAAWLVFVALVMLVIHIISAGFERLFGEVAEQFGRDGTDGGDVRLLDIIRGAEPSGAGADRNGPAPRRVRDVIARHNQGNSR